MGAIMAIALGILVAFGGHVNTVDQKEATQVEGNEDKVIEAYSVSKAEKKLPHYYVEEVLCSLADNVWNPDKQEAIRKQFTDKDVKLSGTVYSAKDDYFGGCRIIFKQKRAESLADGWGIVVCYFHDDTEIEKVNKLRKGDIVTVSGHGDKYMIEGLLFYDCELNSVKSK